jgi:hypothetical protein
MHREFAGLRQQPRRVILAAHARSAGQQHHVGARRGHRLRDARCVVTGADVRLDLAAVARDQRAQ